MEYLDFEKPIKELTEKLVKAKEIGEDKDIDISKTISDIENQIKNKRKEIYSNLSSWQKVQLSRHPNRPYALDYINDITKGDFPEEYMREMAGEFGGRQTAGVETFRQMYEKIGFTRLVAFSRLPIVRNFINAGYKIFAYGIRPYLPKKETRNES